jgi:hypothetical protein
MTKQEIASLSFRFASLYALVQSVEMLSYTGYSIGASPYGDMGNMLVRLTTVLLGAFFLAGLSWYLWVRAGRLSKTLFQTAGAGADATHSSPMEIQEVAYRVLGLYMFFQAFSRLSSVVGSIVARSSTYQGRVPIPPETWVSVATTFVQFALSVWLILGAPKLDELLKIIRREDDDIEDEPQG